MWYCMALCYKSFIPRISKLNGLPIFTLSVNCGIDIIEPYSSRNLNKCRYPI